MLIDVSHKPLIIFPEECTSSVVVRSVGDKTVSGLVTQGESPVIVDIKPGASLKRGTVTCYETKLPLGRTGYVPSRDRQMAHQQAHNIVAIVTPFEVASVYTDILTKRPGTWRASIRVEFLPKLRKSPWVVSVLDGTTGVMLSSVAVSGLDTNPFVTDMFPLKKLQDQGITDSGAPATAWTRLLEHEDED